MVISISVVNIDIQLLKVDLYLLKPIYVQTTIIWIYKNTIRNKEIQFKVLREIHFFIVKKSPTCYLLFFWNGRPWSWHLTPMYATPSRIEILQFCKKHIMEIFILILIKPILKVCFESWRS